MEKKSLTFKIRSAYQEIMDQHDALLILCKELFTEGSTIYWRTRGYLQEGRVESVYPSLPHHGIYIRALNLRTRKTIHVRLYEVDWDVLFDHLSSVEE